MISFKNPEVLFLLLGLIPLSALFLFNLKSKEHILAFFGVKDFFSKERGLYLGLAFILIVLALGEPNGKSEEAELPQEELYFLLDTSSSMSVTDTPSKTPRFQEAISFISQNIAQKNLKSLIVFNETAEMAIPPTFDTPFFQLELDKLRVEEGRSTDIRAPLKTLLDLPTSLNVRKAILVSDGEDQSQESLKPLIEALKKKGFVLSAKIVGSSEGGIVPGVTYHGEKGYSKANPHVLDDTP